MDGQPDLPSMWQAELDALTPAASPASDDDAGWMAELIGLDMPKSDSDHDADTDQLAIVPYAPPPQVLNHESSDAQQFAGFSALTAFKEFRSQTPHMQKLHVSAKHFLGDAAHIVSTAALASYLGTDRKMVRQVRRQTACLSLLYERHMWQGLEKALVSRKGPEVELLLYIDFATYDGVDLTMTARSRVAEFSRAPACADVQGAGEVVGDSLTPSASNDVRKTETSTGTMKLLNSEASTVLVCRVRGELVVFVGAALTPLQTVERNTSECLLAAIKKIGNGSQHREEFCRKLRLTVTDSAGSVKLKNQEQRTPSLPNLSQSVSEPTPWTTTLTPLKIVIANLDSPPMTNRLA